MNEQAETGGVPPVFSLLPAGSRAIPPKTRRFVDDSYTFMVLSARKKPG
jgi:hypothetical protein